MTSPFTPFLLLSALAVAVPAPAQLEMGVGRHPVQARLVAEASSVAPGDTLALGVVLEMAPGWHTYWAFSGDAGLATQVEWDTPEGFEVGSLQWPGPHRYEEAADITVFGYADEVMLITEVRAPEVLPDTLRFTAHVSWLVCREICIPGDTTVAILAGPRGSLPARAELFERYRPQLPKQLSAHDPLRWERRVRPDADGPLAVTVHLQAEHDAAETPDFYPLAAGEGAYIDADTRVDIGPGVADSRLRIVPYTGQAPPTALDGLIVFADEHGRRQFRTLSFDLISTPEIIDLLGTDFSAASGAGAGRGLWLFALMAAVGGLLLNLMPCVLPVISLKAMSLVSQAGQAPARIRQLGLVFAAGIVATFLGLAVVVVVLKAGGEQIGWGFQFQSPAFVLSLTALVFVLGLSLFGVVTVRLPGSVSSVGGTGEGEGLAGSFLNGVLATILATPCTAPFLGTALGFAFSQPAGVVLLIFAATGVGMAMPYLVLAWRPGWVRFLPKPGAWMERFKQGMGFLLMATVLWLLWVLGKQLGMEAVVWTGAFLLCLALGAWLLGSWVDLRSTTAQRRLAWMGAIALAAAGYALFLHPLLRQPELASAAIDSGPWEAFDVDRVESHIADGRIVFIDFTAEWCWTCKVNEHAVLADEEVQERFAALDVALVKADWTNRNPDITRMLRAFGRSGVPLYVIFPAGRAGEPLVLPEVITKGILLDGLDRAVARAG